jgi:tRNA threonylcarbamoyladenosine modification (KEOPS) complex  Pcc1 subunit
MECRAKIVVKGDADKLLRCFAPEETDFDRASFTINRKDDGVEFDIVTKDAVALRATINTITQLLAVFEAAAKKD